MVSQNDQFKVSQLCQSRKSRARRCRASLASLSFLLGIAPAGARNILAAGDVVTPSVGNVAAGVSSLHFPLTPSAVAAVPGLQIGLPPQVQKPASRTALSVGGVRPALQGTDYMGCGQAADAPPQEIIDLAKALQGSSGANGWINIFEYVHNTIDLEASAESSKGALGTYLDQSGSSFDQATLLVTLLRAAGYSANYVVGTTTLNATQLGLNSVPSQLIQDAGGSASGTIPYAWVQATVNGTSQMLDPANKYHATLPGVNLAQWLGTGLVNTTNATSVFNALDGGATSIYNSSNAATQNYESVTAFIGGTRILSVFSNFTGTVGSNGNVYASLPVAANRVGFVVGSTGNATGPSSQYICMDQIYGHNVAYKNNALYIDNLVVQQNYPSPVAITIWHPASTGWSQTITETLNPTTNAIFAFQVGRVGQFRAQHDSNVLNTMASANPISKSSDQALIAAASSQIAQTSRTIGLLDQLAGTSTLVHHILQIVRSNNTIDTPMTSTSVEVVNASPTSGLKVSPQAVSYALSAAQSAQEAMALRQAGATYPVSAATILGVNDQTPTSTQFIPHTSSTTVDPNYSPAQIQTLDSYLGAGYDLIIPQVAPGATAPLGFLALNSTGSSAFVLDTLGGVYKGAADLNPTSGLSATGMGGTAAEAGPVSSGLNVNPSGEITFAAPLISVGSAAPYKLEFDLLYSSRPDAQVTASSLFLTGRPEAPGFSNNFEMRATQTSDGFALVGSDLTAPALPGIVTAYSLLASGNAIASFYSAGGNGTPPLTAAYQDIETATWLTFRGTGNVVTVTQGQASTVFNSLSFLSNGAANFKTPQPSGMKLVSSNGGGFTMTTAQGDQLVFNSSDGQISTLMTASGVGTTFNYSTQPVGNPTSASVNLLSSVQVGSHTLTFGYNNYTRLPATGTYLLQSISDETGRYATLPYGNCFNAVSPATLVPQLCGGTKPDWGGGNAWSYGFGFGQPGLGIGAHAVMLNGIYVANAAQNGLAKTAISYDGARTMPTAVTNANNHTTSYYLAPGRSETDTASGRAQYSLSYKIPYSALTYPPAAGDFTVTDSFDPLGNMTRLQYNYAGQLVGKILPDTSNVYGYFYNYTYDAHGNLASTARGPANQQPEIVTQTAWDQSWNKPHLITDASGSITTYNYDPLVGTLTSVVHPTVKYRASLVQPTETYTYFTNGQLHSATAADGEVTTYGYNPSAFDLISVIVDSGARPHLNLTTSLNYDGVGNLYTVQNARGYFSTMTYDLARRPKTIVTPSIAADGGVAHTTTYTYDLNGRLRETDRDANSTSPLVEQISKQTYDDAGNLLTKTLPTTGATDHSISYSYNVDELLFTTTTPISATASSVRTQTYDNDLRPFQVFVNNVLQETHTYNGDSLPYQIADGAATLNATGVPIGAAHTITYTYDPYDRLIQTTYADGTFEKLTLDLDGRTTIATNRGGLSTKFYYDALNRVITENVVSLSKAYTTTYDLVGRPLTIAYSDGTFAYQYDTAGRQTQTIRPDGKAVGYQYDSDGNTAAITYPDTWVYTYGYDELDRMASVAELAPGASSAKTLVRYGYDPLSRHISNTFGNGTTTNIGYDSFSGIGSIAHNFAGTAPANGFSITYTRDYSERRINDTTSVSTYVWHPSAAGTISYAPNPLNQYASINGQTLNYDTSGNLTADPTAVLVNAQYQFDQLNRMTSATNAQHTATYTYDAFSRRSGKTVDGVGTVFVMNGDHEIADYDTSGNELTRFIYGLDNAPVVEEPVSADGSASNIWYHHLDALGTTLAITGVSGNRVYAYSTSPWGELGGGTVGTPFRFAGMRVDSETLLYYDHARYYSPQQGRFLSPDPISLNGGINIYAYTSNDPLNNVDFTGKENSGISIVAEVGMDSDGGLNGNAIYNPPEQVTSIGTRDLLNSFGAGDTVVSPYSFSGDGANVENIVVTAPRPKYKTPAISVVLPLPPPPKAYCIKRCGEIVLENLDKHGPSDPKFFRCLNTCLGIGPPDPEFEPYFDPNSYPPFPPTNIFPPYFYIPPRLLLPE